MMKFKKSINQLVVVILISIAMLSCKESQNRNESLKTKTKTNLTAKDILGNPDYVAISYGGYREKSRDIQPTIPQIKEDMQILFAMGIRIVRTYNVHLDQASNLLKAIRELKKEDANFEMYVMLGAWIDCENAFSEQEPNHYTESKRNATEIATAVELAKAYPEIVKVIAVGNEAMVKWATSYYVQPSVILKWVNHLQELKEKNELSKDLWITSSDDFSSWGGGETSYHTEDLEKLIKAVDYISMHTYAYHNSHYNPAFWKTPYHLRNLSDQEKVDASIARALNFAKNQYKGVSNYMKSLGVNKPIHIGETGWATMSNGHYGANGSRATDEYKMGMYYTKLKEWTEKQGISCFYFEAFDEQWKDSKNRLGSENHFGLINLKGEAKYPLWDLVDKGVFKGLLRDGKPITKTFNGDKDALMKTVLLPNVEYAR